MHHESLATVWSPAKTLVGCSLCAAAFLFLVGFAPDSLLAVMVMMSGLFASIVLAAAWSVFGPGSHFNRLVWAHLIGAVPICAMGLGLSVSALKFDSAEIWEALPFVLFILLASISAQVAFWLFRWSGGWQFVQPSTKFQDSISIGDLLIITMLVAFACSIPRLSFSAQKWANQESAAFSDQRDSRMLTAANSAGLAVAGISVFVAVFSLPAVVAVLSSPGWEQALKKLVLYLGLVTVVGLILLAFDGAGEAVGYLVFFVFLYLSSLTVPLFFAQASGLQLTSRKRSRSRHHLRQAD